MKGKNKSKGVIGLWKQCEGWHGKCTKYGHQLMEQKCLERKNNSKDEKRA